MKKYTTPEEIDSLSPKAKKRLVAWFKNNDEDINQENIRVLQGTTELHLLSIGDMIQFLSDNKFKEDWYLCFPGDWQDDMFFFMIYGIK